MTRILWALGILGSVTQTSWALSTDFDDLVLGTKYTLGDVISSGDLDFEVVGFTGAPVSVTNGNKAGGSGLELFLQRTLAVDFHLPSQANHVSFLFAELGIPADLVVNGSKSMPAGSWSALDQTTLVGVSILVDSVAVTGGVQGKIFLNGPIQSLVIEALLYTYIDDVLVVVPEPTSFAYVLTGLSALVLFARRGCRQRAPTSK